MQLLVAVWALSLCRHDGVQIRIQSGTVWEGIRRKEKQGLATYIDRGRFRVGDRFSRSLAQDPAQVINTFTRHPWTAWIGIERRYRFQLGQRGLCLGVLVTV